MKKLEIKSKLIAEIEQIENVPLLETLYEILTTKAEENKYSLNEEQISAIEEARAQYKKGEFFSNEEVDRETREWLKK